MKKILCVFLLSFLICATAFAGSDSFSYMYENKAFADVMDAINTSTSYEKIRTTFDKSVKAIGNDIATRLRLKIAYYDYLNTIDNKAYKKELKAGLEDCYKDLELLEKSNTIKTITDSLIFLLYGIDYRITGSLSKGTKSIGYIDDLYKEFSDDEGIMLLYAQRKAEAPKIGGGDTNLALKILTELLDSIENKTNAFKFAVYSELSLVYKKTDAKKSAYYLEKAKSLY